MGRVVRYKNMPILTNKTYAELLTKAGVSEEDIKVIKFFDKDRRTWLSLAQKVSPDYFKGIVQMYRERMGVILELFDYTER